MKTDIQKLINSINYKKLNKNNIENIRKILPKGLSKSDQKDIFKILSHYRTYDSKIILNTVIVYCIWSPKEAIFDSSMKGIFRYRAYGFNNNISLFLLKELRELADILNLDETSVEFLNKKIEISWIFDTYSYIENKIIKTINQRNNLRNRRKINGSYFENCLAKDLLIYIEMAFKKYKRVERPDLLNDLSSYSIEEITESVSYITYLYMNKMGLKDNINYIADTSYILSKEIQNLILLGCQIIKIEEFEIMIDFFNYNVHTYENEVLIFDESEDFEKSLRYAYVKNDMQSYLLSNKFENYSDEMATIEQFGNSMSAEYNLIEEINNGQLSRMRIVINQMYLIAFNKFSKDSYYREEYDTLLHFAKEMNMEYDEVLEKQISENCTIKDLILFQRFFILMNNIISKKLFSHKNKKVILNSLIPSLDREILRNSVNIFLNNIRKVDELLELLTYQGKFKLDLQYTPFIRVNEKYIYPSELISKTKLVRNIIAQSYQIKNQFPNDDKGKEPLVKIASKAFKDIGYQVIENYEYKYKLVKGEVDLMVIIGEALLILECKDPLTPVNNFELRSTYNHILKAKRQLNNATIALSDKSFRNNFRKSNSIQGKISDIKCGIIMGNRLFSGYNGFGLPIRNIYELVNFLLEGVINSNLKNWKLWSGDNLSDEDVIEYFSQQSIFHKVMYQSMEKFHYELTIKGRKILFESYALNLLKTKTILDDNFKSI